MYSAVWAFFRAIEIALSSLHGLLSRAFKITSDKNYLDLTYGAMGFGAALLSLVAASLLLLHSEILFASVFLSMSVTTGAAATAKAARLSILVKLGGTVRLSGTEPDYVNAYVQANNARDGICRLVACADRMTGAGIALVALAMIANIVRLVM